MRRCFVLVLLVVSTAIADESVPPSELAGLLGSDANPGFARADRPRAFTFPADHGPHPTTLGLFSDGVVEVVHVDEGGDATPQHLETGQPRTPPHELLIDVLGFGWKDDLFQPLHEFEIVRQPAEEDHRCVSVGVDQSRKDETVFGIDTPSLGVVSFDLGRRADRCDSPCLDSDRSILDHPAVGIESDYRAAHHHQSG